MGSIIGMIHLFFSASARRYSYPCQRAAFRVCYFSILGREHNHQQLLVQKRTRRREWKLELDAVPACLFVNGTLGHLGCGVWFEIVILLWSHAFKSKALFASKICRWLRWIQENTLPKTAEKKIMFLQSVIASTFIPIFSGIFPCRIRGVPVIDGGFSVNQVVLNEGTVTVSPFAGDAHICPQDDVLDSDMITRVSGNYSGIIGSIDQELLVGHRNRNNKWPKCLKLGKISASDVFVSGTGLPDSLINDIKLYIWHIP